MPTGYYLDSTVEYYKKCDISCSTCENTATFCTKCAPNYYPMSENPNTCKNSYNIGIYFDLISNKYEACDSSCYICKDTKSSNTSQVYL